MFNLTDFIAISSFFHLFYHLYLKAHGLHCQIFSHCLTKISYHFHFLGFYDNINNIDNDTTPSYKIPMHTVNCVRAGKKNKNEFDVWRI